MTLLLGFEWESPSLDLLLAIFSPPPSPTAKRKKTSWKSTGNKRVEGDGHTSGRKDHVPSSVLELCLSSRDHLSLTTAGTTWRNSASCACTAWICASIFGSFFPLEKSGKEVLTEWEFPMWRLDLENCMMSDKKDPFCFEYSLGNVSYWITALFWSIFGGWNLKYFWKSLLSCWEIWLPIRLSNLGIYLRASCPSSIGDCIFKFGPFSSQTYWFAKKVGPSFANRPPLATLPCLNLDYFIF